MPDADLPTFLRARLDEDDRDIDTSRMDPDGAWYLPGMVTDLRLRAEVEAKRRILDLYERQNARSGENAMEEDRAWVLRRAVVLLTWPYADHPDYDPAWRV